VTALGSEELCGERALHIIAAIAKIAAEGKASDV
jgi:hypothetical protein